MICYAMAEKMMITRARLLLYEYSRDEVYLLLSDRQDSQLETSLVNFPKWPERDKEAVQTLQSQYCCPESGLGN